MTNDKHVLTSLFLTYVITSS